MNLAQGGTKGWPAASLQSMIWLTSPTATAATLPALWLIETGTSPANLAERSALRRETARGVLALQLAVPADAIAIGHDSNGRPLLDLPGGTGLQLSLATRSGYVAIALADRPVGVDVERIDSRSELPLTLLHPREREALLDLPPGRRPRAFARLWSAKEAYVKALGLGLVRAPESFCVDLGGEDGFTVTDPDYPGSITGAGRIIKNGGQEILAAAMVTIG
jgi:phosphopantetheinyl transferase